MSRARLETSTYFHHVCPGGGPAESGTLTPTYSPWNEILGDSTESPNRCHLFCSAVASIAPFSEVYVRSALSILACFCHQSVVGFLANFSESPRQMGLRWGIMHSDMLLAGSRILSNMTFEIRPPSCVQCNRVGMRVGKYRTDRIGEMLLYCLPRSLVFYATIESKISLHTKPPVSPAPLVTHTDRGPSKRAGNRRY
jgi:hypothetical protein